MTDKPAWDAWDKLLSAAARSRSKTNHDEALYELAIELRDRLRQSQRDLEEARAAAQQQLDLLAEQAGQQHAVLTTQAVQQQGAVAAAWDNERQHTARVLSTFHDEVLRLTHEVAQQAGAMEAQQTAAQEAQAQAAAALQECQAMASQQQADAAAALSAHRAAAAQQHHQAASALAACQAAAAQQRDEAASALAACQAAAAKEHAADLLRLKQSEAAAARQQSEADATLASHKAEAAAALAAYKTQAAATLAACKAEAQMQQSWLESAVREQEDLVAELREEVQALREAAAAAEVAAHDAALHADAAVRDREAAWAELERLRGSMQQSEDLATHHLQQRVDALGALLATKSRVGQLHQVEGLYHATRDELERLDRENRQLKELVAGGQQQALGGSRLLQALSPGRQRSPPLFLSPQQQGKTRSAVTGKKAVPTPAPQHPATKPQAAGAPASRQLPGMAWLGPPTAQYAADPEKFLFLRVAGGYAPHYVGVEEQPKASGWVPKDVVRLVQVSPVREVCLPVEAARVSGPTHC
ncbi:hypothetical protein QJQ45_005348 [Haematococcus lacustris]|nr:hypothetical protein QJQ45_005348 [Haematococcus lacustris]